jgi:hypothetical protein
MLNFPAPAGRQVVRLAVRTALGDEPRCDWQHTAPFVDRLLCAGRPGVLPQQFPGTPRSQEGWSSWRF